MRTTFWAAALTLATWGCGQDDSAPTSQFQIEGRVLDDLTNAGIAKAHVHFSSDALDQADASTDGDGRYTLELTVRDGVDFGIVTAGQDSYEASSARTVYFDGTTHVIDLRLRAKTKAK